MSSLTEYAVEKTGDWFVDKMQDAGVEDIKKQSSAAFHYVVDKSGEAWDKTNQMVIEKSGGRLDGKTAAIGAGAVVVGALAVTALTAPESAVGATVVGGVRVVASAATKIPELAGAAVSVGHEFYDAMYVAAMESTPQIAEIAQTVDGTTPGKLMGAATRPVVNFIKDKALQLAENQIGKEATASLITQGKFAVATIGASVVSNEISEKATDIARHPYEHLVDAKHSVEVAIGKQDADLVIGKVENAIEKGFGDRGIKFINRLNQTEQQMATKETSNQVAESAIAPVPTPNETKPNFLNGGNKEGFQKAMEGNRPNSQEDQAIQSRHSL